MEFTSETGKIPKGYGYLLKPSVILAALTARDLGGIRIHLVRSHGRRLFDARYRPPDGDIPYERLNIKVGTAHERDLPPLRRQAKDEALPALVRWISDLVAQDLPTAIRRGEQEIELLPPRE
ncbi:hypothetical protein S58_50830 [Bradyrhizobium oligotrophicum S58]|uniref:Uncharacterized protein n=1 Tax=Bradyrhizobium oligotrophicum S58 TaxID=1245469 RepID=M4ZBH2_9BRAD|nr:hypothetical protein [Bradyrhizobium oligotrophicum]BAM91062.1 hypothetical protein S58_50830 [Bradyrhizobium oligotrophicum S58]